MRDCINHALDLVRPQFRLDIHHGWHGIAHWSRVWRNARELCEVMNVDPTVPCLFAFLHDSQRYDEGADSQHGPRAVLWLEGLYAQRKLAISPIELHVLCKAIDGHSDGETEASRVVQICWDSDRLDLGRVGVRPDPRYLCTEHAKKFSTIEAAWKRSIK